MESWGHLHCSYQSSFSHFSSLYEFNWTYLCNSNFTYVGSESTTLLRRSCCTVELNCLLLGLQYTSIRTGLAEHTLSSIMAALTARIKKVTYVSMVLLYCWTSKLNWRTGNESRCGRSLRHTYIMRMYPAHGDGSWNSQLGASIRLRRLTMCH